MDIIEPSKRIPDSMKSEIAEIKRVLTALVKAIKEYEIENDDPIMPVGEYCGIKFEE